MCKKIDELMEENAKLKEALVEATDMFRKINAQASNEVILERLRDLYESAYGAGQNNPNGYSNLHDREWELQDTLRAMHAQAEDDS